MVIYEYLHKIEFTSDRKKMSIFVKAHDSDKITIFTKGADNIII